MATQFRERFWVAKERNRKIKGDLDMSVLLHEGVPILGGLADDELGQREKMRIAVIRDEVRWRNDSPGWMMDSDKGLGTAGSERPQVDLRLVPQFKPAGVERFRDINRGTRRRLRRRE